MDRNYGSIIVAMTNNNHNASVFVLGVGDPTLNKITDRAEVGLSDADATLTADQMINNALFTITPTGARTLTTDTAANLVSAFTNAEVGKYFEFTIINTAAQDVTLSAGSGITIKGNAVVNNASATFIAVFNNVTSGSEAVTIYRK